MNTPRFNNYTSPRATPRFASRKRRPAKRTRISQIGDVPLRDLTGSRRQKILTIVAPPLSGRVGAKPMPCILILDNHPDSLRSVSGPCPNLDVDLAAQERSRRCYVALALCLILMLVFATVWPLV